MYFTYLNRKPRGKFQGHKVSETCKMGTGSSHKVNDGGHLLYQGQRMLLTHPEGTFKPMRREDFL